MSTGANGRTPRGHRPQAVTHRATGRMNAGMAGSYPPHHRQRLLQVSRVSSPSARASSRRREQLLPPSAPAGPFPPLAPTPSLATRRVHDDCIRALTAWGHPKNFLRAAARLVQILLFSNSSGSGGGGHHRRRDCSIGSAVAAAAAAAAAAAMLKSSESRTLWRVHGACGCG